MPVLIALLAVKIVELYDLSLVPHEEISLKLYPGSIVMFSKHEKSKQYDSYYSYVNEKGAYVYEAPNDNIFEGTWVIIMYLLINVSIPT